MARPHARRRIEIGWVEAIVLVFGYVLSLGVVGLGGIYVGQRAVQQRLGAKERVFRLPIETGPGATAPDLGAEEPDITFYEALGKGGPRGEGRVILPGHSGDRAAAPAKPPAAESSVPKVGGAARPGAGSKGADAASARAAPGGGTDAGAGDAARPPKPAQAGQPAAQPAPPAQPVTGAGVVLRPPSGIAKSAVERPDAEGQPRAGVPPSAGLRTPLPSAVANPQVGRRAPPSAVEAPDEDEGTSSESSAQPPSRVTPEAAATARALLGSNAADPEQRVGAGSWSVQVNATQDRGVADRLVSDLRTHGYDAFIVTQTREGAVWYRVRVGRLPSLEKANALVVELKERAGLPHAFVASD